MTGPNDCWKGCFGGRRDGAYERICVALSEVWAGCTIGSGEDGQLASRVMDETQETSREVSVKKDETVETRKLLPEEQGRLVRAMAAGVPLDLLQERYPVSMRYLKMLKRGKLADRLSPGPTRTHKSHCTQGHPFIEENRYYRVNSFGHKESYCRPCAVERIRRYREAKRRERV